MERRLRRTGRGAAVLLPFVLVACQTIVPCGVTHDSGAALVPACHKDPTLEAVACDIDHIEKHIDLWGSITTKHPDVWGAARMTKYQQEVEGIFAQEVTYKNVEDRVKTYQGARARSDQAFLAQAVSLNAALSGQQAALIPPDPITVETGTRTITTKTAADASGQVKDSSSSKAAQSESSSADASGQTKESSSSSKGTQSESSSTAEAKGGSSGSDENKRTIDTKVPGAVAVPTVGIPSDFTSTTSSTVNVNRNPATLASMPGFGSGALQLEPSVLLDEKKRFLDHLNQIRRVNEGDDTADSPGYALYLVRVPVSVLPGKRTDTGHGAEITMSVKPIIGDDLLPSTFRSLVVNDMVDQFSELLTVALNSDRKGLLAAVKSDPNPYKKATRSKDDPVADAVSKATSAARARFTAARPSRHAEYAFPMTHLFELFGEIYVRALVIAAVERFQSELDQNKVIHLHEVRSAVREQVVAGYRFLTTANPHAWSLCTQDLARAVRDLNGDAQASQPQVLKYQKDYDDLLGRETSKKFDITSDRLVMEAIGWAILLESALLTDLLVRDMKETATHKGCPCPAEGWQDYFHPEPSPTARQAFNSYVACRWPMYTFAVDPVTEQQNIQDTLSQRREMQLALSLAFASGSMSAQSFTRFARRLEADYQTIDLNRTVVGFSHGDNTFGWRFYPRFQPPEIPSNFQVVTRDLIGGKAFTKQQELRDRRLEPGQRECMALVIMPSFVPFAEVNISSSWFSLTDPKHKSHSTKETVQLSRRLQAIETVCPKGDEGRYLAGEFSRLQAKAKMLTARLPLQDMKFQVPYENTLGGFAFFNSGITDLSPQLHGWYGADGYDGNAVELFLMGDNFSVNSTSVIAGGRPVPYKLISRQVISVVLPAGMALSEDKVGLYSKNGKFVDVRLATPYGVAGPLRIPAIGPAPADPQPPVLLSVGDGQKVILERDTDLILSGANFTADTRAFAGGKACAVEVLSRGALKVTVPKGVTSSGPTADKLVVEIKVANAGGVSNAILVPVGPAPAAAAPKAAFGTPSLTIGFRYKNLGITAVEEPNRRPPALSATVHPSVTPDATVAVEFESAELGKFSVSVGYNATTKRLEDFSVPLMQKVIDLSAARFGPENTNPPVPIKLVASFKVKDVKIDIADGLTVLWVRIPDEVKK